MAKTFLLAGFMAFAFHLSAKAQTRSYPGYETFFGGLAAQVRYNPAIDDLGSRQQDFPYLVTITIFFDEIDQTGKMVPENRALIDKEEARFVKDVSQVSKGLYGGSFEYLGDYNLYFYVADTSGVRNIAPLLSRFGMDLNEIDIRYDRQWSNYYNFLMPTATDRLRMENQKQIETLIADGDDIYSPRAVTHDMYFEHEVNRKIFIKEAKKLDFEVVFLFESDNKDFPAGVSIVRFDPVEPGRVEEMTLQLYSLCHSLDGVYLGWSTEPVLQLAEE